uniref:Uncharacterized protein n=1 Tax=Callorhinchus milii TaxID=7868 RepID=A0A4W3I040_CALMI
NNLVTQSTTVCVQLAAAFHPQNTVSYCNSSIPDSIYNYGATTIDGRHYISFMDFMGKTVLIVNVASY